jgi:diacylglycerol kinase (ATP)
MTSKNKGIVRILKAGVYSYQGFVKAWKSEAAFRQEACLGIILLPIALFADVSAVELVLLIGSLALVLIVELLNSAIEAIVDRVSLEHHELSGAAKDMGSAAVFISLMLVIFIWVKVLLFQYLV